MCGRPQGQNSPSVPSIALPLKTFQNHLQNFPMTKTQKILENMLFSFRAKRFNSYYDTAVNTKVRHSVKYENVFKHVHLLYQSLSRLCFFSHVFITSVLPMDSVLKFSLCKHINTCGSKAITTFLVKLVKPQHSGGLSFVGQNFYSISCWLN